MIYSVFDYHTKKYDYYAAPGSISPIAKMRTPSKAWSAKGNAFLPQSLAVAVPFGAKRIGSGTTLKGLAASKTGGLSALLPEESKPSAGWAAALVLLGAGGGWLASRYWKKRKKR